MNYPATINNQSKLALLPPDIALLEEKKAMALLGLLLVVFFIPIVGLFCLLFPGGLNFRVFSIAFAGIALAGLLVWRLEKYSRLRNDLRNGYKEVFIDEVEDFVEIRFDKNGRRLNSEFILIFSGEKYAVKEQHYYRFGKGQRVMIETAPLSKYVFHIEKI